MSTENQLENEFEPTETVDDVLDNFLELETEGGTSREPGPLDVEMSPEQAAAIVAEKERLEELQTGQDQNLENDSPDLINQLLEAKGIKNGVVSFENDEGEIEEIPFDELTPEEQFNILNTSTEEPDLGLNEQETFALNFLRENNVTLEEAIDYFSKKAVEEALAGNAPNEDSIETYSDEEIYALDLLSRNKDLTQEEIQARLDKQREHPDLFKQKADELRQEYIELQKTQIAEKEAEIQREQLAELEKVTNSLVSVAKEVDIIGGLDIEPEDKQEVLDFILTKDDQGTTGFGKLLDDPKALFEIAWYAKKGKEAFDVIHDYYKKEISEASKRGYEKGKSEIKTTEQPKNTLRSAVRVNSSQNTNSSLHGSDIKSVEDLYKDL